MKIHTLTMEIYGQALWVRFHEGPVVDIEEREVSWVESASERQCRDEDLVVYLYMKSRPTISVGYCELARVFPKLAAQAKEFLRRKINAPDPLCGSCS